MLYENCNQMKYVHPAHTSFDYIAEVQCSAFTSYEILNGLALNQTNSKGTMDFPETSKQPMC